MIPYGDCKYFSELYTVIQTCFPQISDSEARDVVRQLILAPLNTEIKIDNTYHTKNEIVELLYREINEENNPEPFENRYYRLLESALNTIKQMNDGYVTEEDYNERETFLDKLNKKEFLLFVVLALFGSQPTAQRNTDKERALAYKIARIRELHDLISKYTNDEIGTQTNREDYEQAKLIYKMLKSLQILGYGYTISKKEKQNFGIDHEDDEDLSEDYAFENWIKYLMLRQLKREDRLNAATDTNTIQDLGQNDEKFGYSSTLFDDINEKIAELRGSLQKRKFDSNHFNMLEEIRKK